MTMISGLLAGLLFGVGLSMSGMLDPMRVQGFLDITGAWDPSLAFVLGGAVLVSMIGWAVAQRMRGPLLGGRFNVPTNRTLDRRLLVGAAIFGVGWGLAGFCPGPALASLSLGLPRAMLFVGAMLLAMWVHDRFRAQTANRGGRDVGLTVSD